MKTATQELIEWLNDYPTNVPTIHKSAVISKAESLLKKEKEMIEDIYVVGYSDGDNGFYFNDDYYNETFNNNEK